MSDSDLTRGLKLAQGVWTRDYPDVPWVTQPLKVALHTDLPMGRIQAMLGGLDSLPQAHWQMADGSRVPAEVTDIRDGWITWAAQDWRVDQRAIALILEQSPGTQARGRCVVLQEDTEGSEWLVVYNSLEREKALMGDLQRHFEFSGCRLQSGLLPLLESLLADRIPRAAALLESDIELRKGRSQLEALLSKFQLEANAHGLKRTFRYWSQKRKQDYLKESLEIMRHLGSVADGVCLGFGAVLGWRRESDLVPHDDDLDVLVAFERHHVPDIATALRRVESVLVSQGCIIKGRFFSHLWVQLKAESPQTLDVFVGLIEGSTVSFYPSARHTLQTRHVFPTSARELLGVELPMPAHVDAYLESTYGAAWSSPNKAFNHSWNRDDYADIAGSRPYSPMWTRGELKRKKDPQAA